MSRVAAVVVSFNTRDVLRNCLGTVLAARPAEVVVVDNGSTDGTLEMLERDFADVRLVRAENRGYGAAANEGVRATSSEYVLLLNSDTLLPPNAPEALAAYLDGHEGVGVVGPRLVNPDDSLQRSCFPFPSPRTALLGETGLGSLIRFIPGVRRRHPRTWAHDRARAMPWISGAAMAIRRTAHEEVGGFDERYFMYFEETDLCYRLWRAGWEVHFAPVTDIVHLGAASTSRWAAAMRIRYYESMARFYRTHRRAGDVRALNAIIRATAVARFFATRLRLLTTRSGERRRRLRDAAAAWARLTRGVAVPTEVAGPEPVRGPPRQRKPGQPHGDGVAALRRLDWRFLLPAAPDPGRGCAVVRGGNRALAERLAEAGFADRVSTAFPGDSGGRVDAVAVLRGGGNDLGDVASRIAPGGVLYAELSSFPGWAALRAVRAVRAAGLEPVGRYLVLPSLDAAKVYLPVDTPGALRWVVETLVPASTTLRRLFRTTLRLLGPRFLTRLLPFYPSQALVAVRPPLADRVPAPLARAGATGTPRALVLCDAGNRVVVLPFDAGGGMPTRVVKVPKLPVFNGRTVNEQQRMTEIRDRIPPRLGAALPEPLGLVPLGDTTMALERFRPGESLMVSSGAWRARWSRQRHDLRMAADWVGALHAEAPVRAGEWDGEQRERWVEEPLRAFRHAFGVTAGENALFARLQRHADALAGSPFPLVWWHRDYNIWNLFRADDGLAVIDWEGARPGPPLCDLLHFCTHWYEAVHGLRTESAKLRGFRHLFGQPRQRDRAAAAAHDAIARYMRRLALDPGFYPVLLGFTWIELALRRAEQRRDQGEADAHARQGNRNFPFIALLADGFLERPPALTAPAPAETAGAS